MQSPSPLRALPNPSSSHSLVRAQVCPQALALWECTPAGPPTTSSPGTSWAKFLASRATIPS